MPFPRSGLGSILVTVALLTSPTRGAAEPAATPITAENWTEQVGFKPDLKLIPTDAARRIDARNAAEFKSVLPETMLLLIERYGLRLKLRPYERVFPSEGYITATQENRGKARTVDLGQTIDKRGLTGYVAGLPFPQPSTGLEVAWNFHYAYSGDDSEITYGVYWISANSGLEHTEEWRLSIIRATNRTDIDPMPEVEELASKGLQGAGLTYALAPYDKRGFGAVYFRHVTPRDSIGHIYVPAMRRILKNTFGTRGDTWNATDLLYEDVRGYSGYPEWMHWDLKGKKTILLPMHAGAQLGKKAAKKVYDFKTRPHWNPRFEYEPRPVYVLEAKPKLPDYPYSRQLLYIDAETYQILYKESFDRKGELWKVMLNAASPRTDENTGESFLGWSGTLVIDLQSEHATAFHVYKAKGNLGLDPDKFSVSSLRKRAR